MAFDVLVVNGIVVDGSGARPARRADVGIRDGLIVELAEGGGLAGAAAARTIDAGGAFVTPGFVDLHTHYDGQITWDADLLPSSAHGVTTVVMGNCGVGFAPCRARDREALIALMEGVEDIPGAALSEGIRWAWESFAEYAAALAATPRAIDFGLQVPHDALRVFAMGERALAGAEASDTDVAAMRDELARALAAGAAGFTTGRTDNHRSRSGAATPASEASARELTGIARAFAGVGHGVLQVVSDFDMARGREPFDREFDVIEALAEAAPGHPLSISLMQRDQDADQWRRILARVERAAARGLDLKVQVAPRGIGVILGLEATFHPFIGFPSYAGIARLPLAERVARLRDPAFRTRLLSEKSGRIAGDGSSVPPLADVLLSMIETVAWRFYRLGETPDYEPAPDRSLAAAARRRGVPVLAEILDALLEDDGRALLYFPVYNYTGGTLDAVGEMLRHPRALAGLSDGGAHVGTTCDASFSTFLLSHWVRDRARDRLTIERAVHKLAGETARHVGFSDRGELRPGLRADLNVIDLPRLRLGRPRLVADLPAGGRRLLQDAEGYRATLVGGEVIAEDGRLTGARPGRLVRAGQ